MILPFPFTAQLLAADKTLLVAAVPCAVWPATATSVARAGRHHTHSGEAALEHAAALREPNRFLLLPAAAGHLAGHYKIVGCTPMELVPHCVLELNATHGRS